MVTAGDDDPSVESGELQPKDKLLIEALARDIVAAERLAQAGPAVVPTAGVPSAKPRAGRIVRC